MSVFAAINRDIWRPCQRAYTQLDLERFVAIHAPELVRVEAGARWIGNRGEYAERTGGGFAKAATQGDRLTIDFRFDKWIAGADAACERGVYRVTTAAPGGAGQVFHGRFRSVSRRTTDGWRLIVDYDDDEDGAVGSEVFAAGHAIDDTAPFDA
jgi:hypothetical protein